jgi:DNA-binding beta-propeller fold protein YncE
VKSVFYAGGRTGDQGLAVDSAGNVFLSNVLQNDIIKITPDGVKSTFASGLNSPWGLAFNSSGNLFVADYGSGNIFEFTPDGVRSTFASVLPGDPGALAFLPVPEPSAIELAAVGSAAFLAWRRPLRSPRLRSSDERAIPRC